MKLKGQVLKRLLCLIVVLTMVFAMLPVSTYAANITGGTVLYLSPNDNWLSDNARFAAYFYGASGDAWVSMEKMGSSNIYCATAPSGTWTNVIFCRMNSSSTANNWTNKWNQSGDLTWDGTNNWCSINAGQWDCGTNVKWTKLSFYVAGTLNGWSNNTDLMTDTDGVYQYTYTGVAAGSHEFKVTNGTWNYSWGKDGGSDNYTLVTTYAKSAITVKFSKGTVSTVVVCEHADGWTSGVCNDCGHECPHTVHGVDGKCTVCGFECEHTYSNGTCSVCGAEEPSEPDETETITVYFRNDWLWPEVYVHYWNADDESQTTTWPGEKMTFVETTDAGDVYSAEIPTWATKLIFNGLENGNASNRQQTPDVTEFTDGDAFYIHWDGANAVSKFVYTPTGSEDGDEGGNEGSEGDGEGGEGGDETCTITLHYANTVGWGTVALYSWDAADTTLLGAWPGTVVNQDADGFYTHTYEVESGTTVNFIFNNNDNGSQTADLTLGTVTSDVEKWVTADGRILDEAFRVVTSPVVEDTSVTFNYENADATSVSVRGTMNNWGETALTKDADGVWTLTLTDLEPGVYEYKFYVNDSEWITDPANTWTENENSAFIILDPDAEDTNSLTVNIHYSRTDGNYEGWNFHLWNENGDIKDTSALVGNELVATLVFPDARGVLSVNVIPRFSTADNKWAAQEATYTIDLSNIVSGTVDYYITAGSSGGNKVLNTDIRIGNKLSSVELDYDTGKINVTIAKPVTGAQFGITDGDDPNTYTIYFQNNWLWDDVRIYYWDATGDNAVWPGEAMTKVGNDGNYDIYMAQIPVDVTGFIINGVKNDGSGSRDQTPNIVSGFADGLCYYMMWDNGNQVESFVYDVPVTITETAGSGTTYTLTISEELNLVNLYQYKVVFEGYEYVIDHNAAYASDKFAEEFTYNGTDLGANWNSNYTYFCLWAPTAENVQVQLYSTGSDAEEGAAKLGTYTMTKGEKGTWYVTVNGDLNTVYYTYLVTVNGETVEAVDPYARTTGVNGVRGMVIDLDSTDPIGWDSDENPNPSTSYTDAIIYELHVRDFSIDSSSGILEDYMGKFLAFTQTGTTVNGEPGGLSTGIDYLKSLGVTHVHLLPVYDYGSVDETKCENFNWGYDPVNYNVPEGSYSTNPYKGEVRVEEMKQMIQALHNAGISVIMDVVYNHVYDAGEFCYNQIVPGYFSRPSSNASGCGNDTASEREMVSKYIVESVDYWSDEYHIDGFRFDLVGLIDVDTINALVEKVHEERPDTIFYGEGWNMDSTNKEEGTEMAKQGNADKTPGFAYFSDSIRNQIAGSNGTSLGFVSGGDLGNLMAYYLAQPESWGETWTNNPTQVVQYASCHDNYTLIDKLILSAGAIGITDDIISMNNLSAVIYMTSQGIPFIHAGEEMLREKLEEDGGRCENSYNASDFVNSIKWDNLLEEEYADTVAYYQGLIALRKAHAALRMNNADDVAQYIQAVKLSDSLIAFYIDGSECNDDDMVIIFNAGSESAVVDLPEGIWNVCVDDENAGTDTLYTAEVCVQVKGISAMILTQTDAGEGEVETGSGSGSGDTITLYFSNNKHWSNVNAYAWDASGILTNTWPGTAMTYVETNDYGEDIYKITIPASATGLIFNNGTEQTEDLTPGVNGTGYYCNDNSSGKWTCGTYTYTSAGGASFGNDGVYEGESTYYLFGWINGEDYACENYSKAMGKYQFVNGKLTVRFAEDSYVGVKTTGNGIWYMTNGWQGNISSVALSDTTTLGSSADKMMVPGGVELTFTLTDNNDGTLTLSYEAEDVSVTDETGIQNGVTLHCWNWSFAEIEANMALIAEMGFSAIQTSPVQPVKQTTSGYPVSDWWVYYQPVDFTITDAQGNALGTKADLQKMIKTAHSYGIKVIVDVVANHLGNQTDNDLSNAITGSLLDESNWHDITVDIADYKDRYDTTQHCLNGLPDLNTAEANVQQMVLSFLKDCIDIGVDGFRFDAAKHIETPDDELAYDSDFWPVVVGGARDYAKSEGKKIYVYGETLDGTEGHSISDYTEYMSVTDNVWSDILRNNMASGNVSISAGYEKVTDASNLVIWAESHDTYADGTSSGVSVENINKTWALVAARADAMGLYLSRPESSTLLLGKASVTGWSSDEVKAVNEFRNAFIGETETVGSSGNFAYVVRSDSGIVLVNVKGTSAAVNVKVAMADGKYVDQITGNIFTVSSGTLTGNVGPTGIAVVHNTVKSVTVTETTGGTVTVSNETPVTGETVTVTVAPNVGKEISDVVITDQAGADVPYVSEQNGTFTFVQSIENVTVTVTFADKVFHVNVAPHEGGDVTVNKESVLYNEEVTITVTPDTGKKIASVTVNDSNVTVTDNGDGTYTYAQPAGNVTVTVTFADIEYAVDVTDPQGGDVTVSNETPVYGEEVTITVTPDTGKKVASVTVNNGDVTVTDNGDGTYTYTQPAGSVTVTVTFADIEYTADVAEPEGGNVAIDKAAPVYGEEVTITVTPDTGKEVASVTVTDAAGNAITVTNNGNGTYTYTQPAGNVTVTVTFKDAAGTETDSPDTGDSVHMVFMLTALISAMAMAVLLTVKRRKETN